MATPSLQQSEFPMGECPACAKQVLTHIELGADDIEVRRCIHCSRVIPLEDLRWTDASELGEHGYALLEARTCGNGGGCRSGHCGARA